MWPNESKISADEKACLQRECLNRETGFLIIDGQDGQAIRKYQIEGKAEKSPRGGIFIRQLIWSHGECMLQIVSGKMNGTAGLHCKGSALGPKVEMWIFCKWSNGTSLWQRVS